MAESQNEGQKGRTDGWAPELDRVINTSVLDSLVKSSSKRKRSPSEEKENSKKQKPVSDEEKVSSESVDYDNPLDEEEPELPPEIQALSNILIISGLKRPYSIPDLKSFLEKNTDFWVNKLRSVCIVKFNTAEDAKKVYLKAHGATWPPREKHILSATFISEEEADEAQKNEGVYTPQGTKNPSQPLRTSEEWLNQYFRHTKAQPKLYWMPVPEEEATKREAKMKEKEKSQVAKSDLRTLLTKT
eukprot:TRINITY_DN11911_c0_g1_i5.p1 TRINITY_DN11911_c0_g1~~TRINITY_DN11911_c0_g1_i5.p1  ORF type:complete len:244 (-),score=57.19 TRINITY_DN11911_c0_g1_i5:137-868(-)